jgi:2-polyprenyl-3-methyl-5-hydroxy-6-metoxy-1,4-benzoquinol methylase
MEAMPDGRIYSNDGNPPLLDFLSGKLDLVLDVGCGAGDNAIELRRRYPEIRVHGITRSAEEAAIAKQHMECCWVADLEDGVPLEAKNCRYDAVIFSHVLEHLRDPAEVVAQASMLLRKGGACVIAVPNVLAWAQRTKFLRGNFEYESAGVMDETHLRFFTYNTASEYLLGKSPELLITHLSVTGSVPLWMLRRRLLPKRASQLIDRLGCRLFPNLFGYQVLIRAVKHR